MCTLFPACSVPDGPLAELSSHRPSVPHPLRYMVGRELYSKGRGAVQKTYIPLGGGDIVRKFFIF